jgi:hypothetical protein
LDSFFFKRRFNVTSLRINLAPGPDLNTKVLTYSSISHIGWISIAVTTGENLWTFCFVIYSVLVLTVLTAIKLSIVSFVNQILLTNKEATVMKFIIFTQLLSVGGCPHSWDSYQSGLSSQSYSQTN